MNIHPFFVHFPIALLTVYSLTEWLRFRFLKGEIAWFYIKALLVTVGTLSGYLTLFTGDLAEDLVGTTPELRHLIEVHSTCAGTAIGLYSAIMVSYFVVWFKRTAVYSRAINQPFLKKFLKILDGITGIIHRPPVLVGLSILGLAAITVTGALGASIVYGPNIDPFVHYIYRLFVG